MGTFNARIMGTCEGVICNPARGVAAPLVGVGKLPVFIDAAPMTALKPLPVVLAAHRVFADETPRPIEGGVAPACTERVVMVLDWIRKLRAAAQIAAVMPC